MSARCLPGWLVWRVGCAIGNRADIEENGRETGEEREMSEWVSMHVKREEKNEEKLKKTELRGHR